ncbi:baseplate assembly protein [Paenibacillus macquariensis]|uniref:Phage-related baseplate assembly protein n=1 Tax=Paenibacillus macquariensis TaxID=948756 RepID=A0ABY1K782_9BACL|nr:baseplate J/gp47 family protein [Paenibacillus macquariensis]MEC0092509.1 baseplate J/gp47 family protein [Paenibacillus macquariensis]OAB35467.1 baseplate J protein [Paenibacillus macquariensis subsp. macquariensis]SIR35232.1 Phage-related baseplate assembly protein [Paenibacillus macquariensis]
MGFVELPEISFVDTDVTSILNTALRSLELETGRILNKADPERILFLALMNIIIQQRHLIDQAKKADLLPVARGVMLDYIGSLYNNVRLASSSSRTTIKFTLSTPLTSAQIIPMSTRVGPQGGDGTVYFSTIETVVIDPGDTSIEIISTANIPGDVGNGFLIGQLNVLIDPLPFIQSVTNVTESGGGADVESDDAYRDRIRLTPESFSTAGPRDGYVYWAKTANPAIVDVALASPEPYSVVVVPLMLGGEIPTPDILDAVEVAVNDRTRRPLTDFVTVKPPELVSYNITLTYYINRERSAESSDIQAAIDSAIKSFSLWQKSKLGRAINPSELIGRIMAAGALRVEVISPNYMELASLQVARENDVTITYGGLDDD